MGPGRGSAGTDAGGVAVGAAASGVGAAADCNTEVSADAESVTIAVRCNTAPHMVVVHACDHAWHYQVVFAQCSVL